MLARVVIFLIGSRGGQREAAVGGVVLREAPGPRAVAHFLGKFLEGPLLLLAVARGGRGGGGGGGAALQHRLVAEGLQDEALASLGIKKGKRGRN